MDNNKLTTEKMIAEHLVPGDERTTEDASLPIKRTMAISLTVIALIAIAISASLYSSREDTGSGSSETSTPAQISKPIVQRELVHAVETTAPAEPNTVTETVIEEPDTTVNRPQSLDGSDSQVLLALADFSPILAKWLIPSEQIRKWVLTVDLIADGKLPKRYRPLDYPVAKFIVLKDGDKQLMSSKNFTRLQPLIDTVISIDPATLARYYQQWLPLLDKAYGELGKPGTFKKRFRSALNRVIDNRALDGDVALTRPSVFYQYRDKDLEQASDVDKLLWRMGSKNSEELQFFLTELRFNIDRL